MARPRKHSRYSRFRAEYVTADMDFNFVSRNWRTINNRPISKAAGTIRKIMRGSIRRAYISKKTGLPTQRPSKPGKPPKSRYAGHPFKNIQYRASPDEAKAVIGHIKLPFRQQDPRRTPMEAHEFGKTVQIKTIVKRPKKKISDRQRKAARRLYLQGRLKSQRPKARFVTRTVRMPKRPFAYPALKKYAKKLGWLWKNSVNRSTVSSQMNYRF